MSGFDWKKILSDAAGRQGFGSRFPGVGQIRTETDQVTLAASIRRAWSFLAPAAGLAATCSGAEWVQRSPVFVTLGSGGSLAVLCVFWLFGVVVYGIGDCYAVCESVEGWLPFGEQPYRSGLGVLLFFLILGLVLRRVRLERLPGRVLVWVRLGAWGLVALSWLGAVVLFLVRFVH